MRPHDAPASDVLTAAHAPPLVDGFREVGPYKLLSLLGEGGMGIVYLAEQASPIRRRVALKVLKPGMDTQQVVARFESERQALAVMDHPNIAKVFDGGATPSGRPYFAMELAHGTPITLYADTHCLDVPERLRLFLDVCHAVQHAHLKGVIHRDLKPSNVLVAAGDDSPVVKVIDFGIAKAAGVGLTERTLVTRVGQMIGTPEYMSPEQAEMSELDVDTRTDVYSLGVMLYEFVVGTLPFDLASKPDYAIPHALRERDVPRPSLKLTTLGDALDTIARHRRATPEALRRELRGDLDWIILRAMEKDRTRRYDTPNGLAADIQRYLTHEPVTARPPSTAYRVRKFVRRNRVTVVAAGIALVAVLGGAAAAAAGLVQARREQARAEAAAEEARVAAETADRVTGFLVDLFEVSSPGEARGSTVTAREILDRGAARIDTELGAQPLVQARLKNVIGTVYHQLGLYGQAVPLLESAAAVAEAAAGPYHPLVADALTTLGVTYRQLARYADAERVLSRALVIQRAAGAADTPDYLLSLRALAGVHLMEGRFADAEPLLQDVLRLQLQQLGPAHRDVGATYSNIGVAAMQAGDLASAEQALLRAVAIREQSLGPDNPVLGTTISNLASVYHRQGRYGDAEREYERAASIMEAGYGPAHPYVGQVLNNVGDVRLALGRHAEAEVVLLRALAIKEQALESGHPSIAITLTLLGNVYRDQRRLAEAEARYVRAVRIIERGSATPGEGQKTHENFAQLLRLLGRTGEASAHEARAAALAGTGGRP
jgi:eukaryotic-like serine/threonine-protein kinase